MNSSSNTRMMVWAAMFSAFAVVVAMLIRIPVTPLVPFSLLPFVSLLAGAVLGSRWGAMSMLLYVLMGLVGIPVFENGGGPMYILQPTFGFLMGFVVAPLVIGVFVRKAKTSLVVYIFSALLGVVIIYAVGLPYLYIIVNFVMGKPMAFSKVMGVALYPFIGFDILKAVIAGFLAKTMRERLLLNQSV